ncbi:MAG: hypothetical protein BWX66_01615 [Deltaproteobacteria bacterium ADurb.Bin058]|nr:MAG: hypothetical protein BWX66_01615 [Deltaproteobacteria bacterium ADurb.Bin058]
MPFYPRHLSTPQAVPYPPRPGFLSNHQATGSCLARSASGQSSKFQYWTRPCNQYPQGSGYIKPVPTQRHEPVSTRSTAAFWKAVGQLGVKSQRSRPCKTRPSSWMSHFEPLPKSTTCLEPKKPRTSWIGHPDEKSKSQTALAFLPACKAAN